MPPGYETKFRSFIEMCEVTKKEGIGTVLIATPTVLGDTYEEVIESLSRLQKAGLALRIATK